MTDLFEAGWSSVQLLWISMLIVEEKFLKKVEKTNTTVIGRDPKNHGLKEVLMVEVSTDRRTLVRRCYRRDCLGYSLNGKSFKFMELCSSFLSAYTRMSLLKKRNYLDGLGYTLTNIIQ